MIKAVKKLKSWSRKKRSRKIHRHPPPPPYDPPPPPLRCQCHCCSSSSTAQPSAPPLPPWMDYTEQTHEIEPLPAPELHCPAPEVAYHPLPVPSKQPSAAPTSSYQQYMIPVPDPVYGIPVAQAPTVERERSAGFFGYVVDYLFNLFPCFRIREAVK
ncbi:vegetative cell wall protein gp1 [Argentina anserina]|uniref:vegetative cell wall protein gp1 n=1 Tax=Argentina anserina TaxID=57926 RepID=UPI0021764B37|nr:vegetative cell wall protein gp1 [Potentilla anserina]